MSENLVEVKHLQQYFPAGGMGKNKQYVQAVDDVSFAIRKGETLPEGTGSASLGIRNVHERVKIIYGQESGLSITITEKGNTLSRMNIKFEQDGQ